MLKTKLSLLLIVAVFLSGCASIKKRNHIEAATEVDGGNKLSISYEINSQLSSEHFGMFEFIFHNPSDKWVIIKSVELIIDDKLEKSVKLTSGLEFDNWRNAMRKTIAVRNYNTSVLISGLMVASAVAASSSDSSVRNTGLAGFGLTAGSQTVRQFSQAKDRVESANLFPQSHLLRTPEKVPPRLFIEKWLLVDTSELDESTYLNKFALKVTYDDLTEDTFPVAAIQPKRKKFIDWQKEKRKAISKKARSDK